MDFENMAVNMWESAFDMDMIGTPEEEKQEEIAFLKQALESLAILEKEKNDCGAAAILGTLYRIFDN